MNRIENKKAAYLTSGGVAPGMNPALRTTVRVPVGHGLEVITTRSGLSQETVTFSQEAESRCAGRP